MSDEDISTMSDEDGSAISDEDVSAISDEDVSAISDENLLAISDEDVSTISDEDVSAMSNEDLSATSDEDVSAMSDEDAPTMSDDGSAISDKDVSAMPDVGVSTMSDEDATTMSYADEKLAQCLFLAVHEEKITNEMTVHSSDIDKGYVLLPHKLNNEAEICKIISRNGIQIIRNAEGCPSLLTKAVKEKRVEIVEMFLHDPIFDSHTEDACSLTHLTIHVEKWKVQVGKALLSRHYCVTLWHGVDDPVNYSVLNKHNLEIFEHLLNFSSDIYVREEYYWESLMHFAALRGSEPLAKLLLKNGVDIDIKTFGGKTTPLFLAICNLHESMVEYLLQEGADVNGTKSGSDVEGYAPLCVALHSIVECYEIVKYYKDREFNIPVRSRIVERLFGKGANVNVNSSYGCVLNLAIKTNPQILSSVLRHHPDLNSKVHREAFQKALSQNNKEMIDLLQNYGFTSFPDNLDSFFQAISRKNVETVQQFVKDGVDVNHYCSSHVSEFYGMRPLHVAAENFLKEIFQLLLDHGAEVTVKSTQGTPLFHAVKVLNLKAVKFLLTKGARVQDNPLILHAAAEAKPPLLCIDEWCGSISLLNNFYELEASLCYSPKVHIIVNKGKTSAAVVPVIELLLKYGACFDPENGSFRSSLMGHVHLDNWEVVEILLKHKFEESDVMEAMIRAILTDSQKTLEFLLKYGSHLLPEKFGGRSLLEQSMKQWVGYPKVFLSLLNYNYLKLKLIAASGVLEFIERKQCQQEYANDKFDLGLDDAYYYNSHGCTQDKIIKHIIKIKAANLRINHKDSSRSFSRWVKGMNKFTNTCKSEIRQLKNKTIGNSCVSFYNILDANAREMSCYLKNPSVANVLKAYDKNKKEFPLYWNIIDARFQKGFYRESLIKQCILSFDVLAEKSAELPHNIREKILNYLSNPHLLIFSNISGLRQKKNCA